MPSTALTSIRKLRRLAAALEAGDADSKWLASRLRQYLDGAERGLTIEMAVGLSPPPGQAAWWTLEAVQVRDAALQELAEHFWPERTPGAQARAIEQLALRYFAASWRFDCDRADMPERYGGTATEPLWRAFKSGATMPLKWRQIANILTAEKKDAAA